MSEQTERAEKTRTYYLSTLEMYNLDTACRLITRAFGKHLYLVGTCAEGKRYRDVDVRLILDDDQFDALFPEAPAPLLWELLCIAIGDYLRQRTGLPIDFQIQRRTEANEKHSGPRNPLGRDRHYAGGGDGTPKWMEIA
jgi:hypothetical protein